MARQRTGVSSARLALLHLALLLAREALLDAAASRSDRLKAVSELLYLDRLELREEGCEGGAEEEVELLNEERALKSTQRASAFTLKKPFDLILTSDRTTLSV